MKRYFKSKFNNIIFEEKDLEHYIDSFDILELEKHGKQTTDF